MERKFALKIVIWTSLFFIIGTALSMFFFNDNDINMAWGLLAGYLIGAIPFSVMRLRASRSNTANALFGLAYGENAGTFISSFFLVRWIINYIVSAIIVIFYFIKSIVVLVRYK